MKARISASIEKTLKDMLYDHVKAKFQGFRGGLSIEIESALTSYLEDKTRTNTHKNFTPGISRIERTVTEIIREINHSTGFNKDFSLTTFEMACSKVVGSDVRTVQKYLKWTEKLGKIRHRVGIMWEFVLEETTRI